MRINWSNRAVAELKSISDEIEKDDPEAAERVVTRIFDRVLSLASMPQRGKPGRIRNTRESFMVPFPYFIVYRIVGEQVRIMRIRHTARQWPERG